MSSDNNVQTLAAILIVVAGMFCVVTFLLTCLRCVVVNKYASNLNHWVRRFSWFLPLATVLFIVSSSSSLAAAAKQLQGTPHTSQITQLLQIGTITYFLSTGFTKLSLYSHLSSTNFWAKQLLNWTIVLLALCSAVGVGFTLLPCGSVAWSQIGTTCNATLNVRIFATAWTALNVAVDVIMMLFAVVQIYSAYTTPTTVRRLAGAVLGVCLLSTAAATCRLAIFASQMLSAPGLPSTLTQALLLSITGVLELGLAIAAGCLLTFRPLLSAHLGEPQVIYEAPAVYSRPTTARPSTATGLLQESHQSNFDEKTKGLYLQTRQVKVEDWVDTQYRSPRAERKKKRGGGLYQLPALDIERGLGYSKM